MENEISLRYANALYLLAKERNSVSSLKEEVITLIDILEENPKFIKVLGSSFISEMEKEKILINAFKNINEDILGLFKVIIKNNRASLIIDILKNFNTLCNRDLNIKEGIIYSTYALSKDELNEINNVFSKKEGMKVELKNRLDSSLIGGVKVSIEDKVYDGSILAKINSLKENLNRRKN